MPFIDQITRFINDSLKAGSLNKQVLQPAIFYGLASTIYRSKGDKKPGNIEPLPAIIDAGKEIFITPESKLALKIYHKQLSKSYSYDKNSYGDGYNMKSVSEMNMVVITNSKLSGKTKDVLEPVIVFGMPQRLSNAMVLDLGINNCLITPTGANMDAMQVFRQEYPRSDYFLNEQMSIFLIRYRIEINFSQKCIDTCLCE
jgi:hypothetical protein